MAGWPLPGEQTTSSLGVAVKLRPLDDVALGSGGVAAAPVAADQSPTLDVPEPSILRHLLDTPKTRLPWAADIRRFHARITTEVQMCIQLRLVRSKDNVQHPLWSRHLDLDH